MYNVMKRFPKSGQVCLQPALIGPQIGDIADPFFVWSAGAEILSKQIGRNREIVL